jgi:hypothetical protein
VCKSLQGIVESQDLKVGVVLSNIIRKEVEKKLIVVNEQYLFHDSARCWSTSSVSISIIVEKRSAESSGKKM